MDFSEVYAYFLNVSPRNPAKNPKNAKNAENAKNAKNAKTANQVRSANIRSSTTKAYSITMAGAKKGGRWWCPPRGLQSAAHRRCAKRAELKNARYAKFAKILALSSASKF